MFYLVLYLRGNKVSTFAISFLFSFFCQTRGHGCGDKLPYFTTVVFTHFTVNWVNYYRGNS